MAEKLIKVYLPDGSVKALRLHDGATVGEIVHLVADKLEIPHQVASCFCLWGSTGDLSRAFDNADLIADTAEQWRRYTARHGEEAPSLTYVLKRRPVMPVREEVEVIEHAAIHLLYLERVSNIIHSEYKVEYDCAVRLAAIQLAITYGDFKAGVHKPGFLGRRLPEFMPTYHLHLAKSADKVEKSIFAHFHKLPPRQNLLLLKLMYLDVARMGCPYYGAVMFKGTVEQGSKHEAVTVAVTHDAVHCVASDMHIMEVAPTGGLTRSIMTGDVTSLLLTWEHKKKKKQLAVISPEADEIESTIAKMSGM